MSRILYDTYENNDVKFKFASLNMDEKYMIPNNDEVIIVFSNYFFFNNKLITHESSHESSLDYLCDADIDEYNIDTMSTVKLNKKIAPKMYAVMMVPMFQLCSWQTLYMNTVTDGKNMNILVFPKYSDFRTITKCLTYFIPEYVKNESIKNNVNNMIDVHIFIQSYQSAFNDTEDLSIFDVFYFDIDEGLIKNR